MAEQKYTFEYDNAEKKSKASGFMEFLWNSRTKEFCGRDGMSWAKVSFFYAVFYLGLGSFFLGMLAIFASQLPKDRPTYYGTSSVMNTRGLNPGLGFRPHLDAEDYVIKYNPEVHENPKYGLQKYIKSLRHFLQAKYKYSEEDKKDLITCAETGGNASSSYIEDFKNGKSCEFNYENLFKDTPCSESKDFGYTTDKPCVLLKINKIVSWEPKTTDGYIKIKCAGEYPFDEDNIQKVEYYSEGQPMSTEHGFLSAKYYPFYGQKNYKAPFIWARFTVSQNTFINVECKAYAENIDNEDRLNRRGQTKFALFVTNQKYQD